VSGEIAIVGLKFNAYVLTVQQSGSDKDAARSRKRVQDNIPCLCESLDDGLERFDGFFGGMAAIA
jgi:hypothetical protein